MASDNKKSHHLNDFPLPTGPGAPFKLRPWCLVLACCTWVWCVWPCRLPCPWTGHYDREHTWWRQGFWLNWEMAPESAWEQPLMPLPDLLCLAILSHTRQLLSVVLSIWFLLLWQHNYFLLSCVCFFWVGYVFLKKEQLQLYPMSTCVPTSGIYIVTKLGFYLCSPPFLIISVIQFACCWTVSQCFPRTVRNDSNILPQVVIASLESIIAFMHIFFSSDVHYSAFIGTEFNLLFYCQVTQYREIIP